MSLMVDLSGVDDHECHLQCRWQRVNCNDIGGDNTFLLLTWADFSTMGLLAGSPGCKRGPQNSAAPTSFVCANVPREKKCACERAMPYYFAGHASLSVISIIMIKIRQRKYTSLVAVTVFAFQSCIEILGRTIQQLEGLVFSCPDF